MYKVFFKDSCFLLTEQMNFPQGTTHSLIHREFQSTKQFILRMLSMPQPFTAAIYHDDLEDLLGVFKSCFLYVKAAGGLVQSENKLLTIKRLGMYDLPKGHLEPGETIEECALREVREECGINGLQIASHWTDTLHIYYRNDTWHLKKTYWYAMTCPPGLHPTPQTEEDIEEAFWLPLEGIDRIVPQTYPSLREIFLTARQISG